MEKWNAECETNLGTNKMYSMLIQDYVRCVTFYMQDFPYSPLMQKQLERTDLDTVCAFELYQMKKNFVNGKTLDFKHFINDQ